MSDKDHKLPQKVSGTSKCSVSKSGWHKPGTREVKGGLPISMCRECGKDLV